MVSDFPQALLIVSELFFKCMQFFFFNCSGIEKGAVTYSMENKCFLFYFFVQAGFDILSIELALLRKYGLHVFFFFFGRLLLSLIWDVKKLKVPRLRCL